MLKVNMPGQRIAAAASSAVSSTASAGGAGTTFGLEIGKNAAGSTDIAVNSSPTSGTVALTSTAGGSISTTYYTGGSGVVANPAEPILPLERLNIGVSGKALRGVGFRSGSYSDLADIIPLTSSPTTESSRGFASFYSQTFYPTQAWTIGGFGALSGGTSNLAAIVGQYRSNGPGTVSGTLRLFSSMSYRTYYLDQGWAQSIATREAGVAPAPQILQVTNERLSPTAVRVRVFAASDPSIGVQEVWITYTDQAHPGSWQSIDLAAVPGDPGYWSATANLPETAVFMAQAVSATGLVSLDTNDGAFYPVAPLIPQAPPAAPTSTALVALSPPVAGIYGQPASFSARLTTQGGSALGNRQLRLSIGSQSAFAVTNEAGEATLTIILSQPSGSYTALISFASEPGYTSASLALPFAIEKEDSALTISPASSVITTGSGTGISAKLTDAGGAPIVDRTVIFIGTGTSSSFGQSVKTGPNGQAILGVVSWPVDTYSVRAYFVGSLPLPDGSVNLTDLFYNSSFSSAASLTILPLPETTIIAGPSGTVAATKATFKFTGSGGNGTLHFECSLDGSPFTTCVSPKTYTGLAMGDHLFLVQAIDAQGTADPTPASVNWTISANGQTLYRARQDGERIVIERNIALAGLGDYDGAPVDGWAVVGRTSDRYDDGVLGGFYEQDDIPYVVVCFEERRRGHRCILMTPHSLDRVQQGQPRILDVVRDPMPYQAM
jgi:hypothetical protein